MAPGASAWMESVKEYLEPAAKIALDAKDQIENYDYKLPLVVVESYKSAASTVGLADVSPVYVGAGAIAASGVVYMALRCSACSGARKKKSSAGRGKKKAKAKGKGTPSATNGTAHKEGVGGRGRGSGAGAGGGAENKGTSKAAPANGVASRGVPVKGHQPKGAEGKGSDGAFQSAAGSIAKPAKKSAGKASQSSSKGKGKSATQPPPVITEEPEAAKKKTRKKKGKVSAATATAADADGKAGAPKTSKKGSSGNGAAANGSGLLRATPNGGKAGGGVEAWEDEWQTAPMGAHEGEWETVSHKKSRPRKEKAAVDDANAIPGGLGL